VLCRTSAAAVGIVDVMQRIWAMVSYLYTSEEPFSRNRNFAAHEDPRFARAVSLHRHLRGLASDLQRLARTRGRLWVETVRDDEHDLVRLTLEGITGRRTTLLHPEAWRILRTRSDVATALDTLLHATAATPGHPHADAAPPR
jgi:hypothetical protein